MHTPSQHPASEIAAMHLICHTPPAHRRNSPFPRQNRADLLLSRRHLWSCHWFLHIRVPLHHPTQRRNRPFIEPRTERHMLSHTAVTSCSQCIGRDLTATFLERVNQQDAWCKRWPNGWSHFRTKCEKHRWFTKAILGTERIAGNRVCNNPSSWFNGHCFRTRCFNGAWQSLFCNIRLLLIRAPTIVKWAWSGRQPSWNEWSDSRPQ